MPVWSLTATLSAEHDPNLVLRKSANQPLDCCHKDSATIEVE